MNNLIIIKNKNIFTKVINIILCMIMMIIIWNYIQLLLTIYFAINRIVTLFGWVAWHLGMIGLWMWRTWFGRTTSNCCGKRWATNTTDTHTLAIKCSSCCRCCILKCCHGTGCNSNHWMHTACCCIQCMTIFSTIHPDNNDVNDDVVDDDEDVVVVVVVGCRW